MRTLLFLLTITFLCTPAKGQMYERYKKYEQMLKQREKAGNYARQSYENYNKSRTYSYKVYQPGNTEKERNANLKKAQSYYMHTPKTESDLWTLEVFKITSKIEKLAASAPKESIVHEDQYQSIRFNEP